MGCTESEAIGVQPSDLADLTAKKETTSKDVKSMGTPKIEMKEVKAEPSRKKQYSKKPPILLGYWKIRGLAQPLRYMLEYSEHPYQDVMYEQGDGPNYSVECWTAVKNTLKLDFPSVPYLIDEETRLTDPYAMTIYLANSYCPELLGKTPHEKGELDLMYT